MVSGSDPAPDSVDPESVLLNLREQLEQIATENCELREENSRLKQEIKTIMSTVESARQTSTFRTNPRVLLSPVIDMEGSDKWNAWTVLSYHEVFRHFFVDLESSLNSNSVNEGEEEGVENHFDLEKYPWKLGCLFTFYIETLIPYFERYENVMSKSYIPWLLGRVKDKVEKDMESSNSNSNSNSNGSTVGEEDRSDEKVYQSLLYNEYTNIELVYENKEVKLYQRGSQYRKEDKEVQDQLMQPKDDMKVITFNQNDAALKEYVVSFRGASSSFSRGNTLSVENREKFQKDWLAEHLKVVRDFIALFTKEMNMREALIPQILQNYVEENEEHAKLMYIARTGVSSAHIEITMVCLSMMIYFALFVFVLVFGHYFDYDTETRISGVYILIYLSSFVRLHLFVVYVFICSQYYLCIYFFFTSNF